MTKKLYDPKLRLAMREFDHICKKYDCMGIALLVSPTHSEFANRVEASWSVMRREPNGQIRFRAKKEDFKSKEDQHFHVESTVHGVTSIINWSRQTYGAWDELLAQLQTRMKIFYSIWDQPDSVPGDGK